MFPSVTNDNLPASESFNHSPNLALHIATLHSARRPFIACQSSEKIKQALRNNIRSSGQIIISKMKYITNVATLQNGKDQQKY